jgi:hypothetical protein
MSKTNISGYTAVVGSEEIELRLIRYSGMNIFKPWLNKQVVLCSVLWSE